MVYLWYYQKPRRIQLPHNTVYKLSFVVASLFLGVYLDADVSMAEQVAATVRACFAALRQIRSVRSSLPRDAVITLIRAL